MRPLSLLFLGSGDRLDVDLFAVLTQGTAAARNVAAASQGSTVETVLELPAYLLLPGLDGHAVLLLDLVAVPFWYYVKGTKWYDPQVWGEVVDVAALESLL